MSPGRWLFWSWVLLAAVWLYLAWVPVTVWSQAAVAWGLVGLLWGLSHLAPVHALLRLIFLLLAALVTARYMIWRVTETLGFYDLVSWIAAVLLFAAEVYAVILYALGIFVNAMPLKRASTPLPDDPALWPTVDVFVPSYNEDADILENTLIAACNIRYAPGKLRVYLLDDGGTDQKRSDPDPARAAVAQERQQVLQRLCAEVGAHYLTRARNLHAKAGNINSALGHTSGDLVVIFDADHVPTADFLERTVGGFVVDPKLFLVQTPHFFVNPDPLEHNWRVFGRIPSENEMFYDVIQHGLDTWEASFFCGSAAVLRRAALAEVGGITTETLTEDAETALRLHARGWKSAYINHPMIAGLQPETYSGFITQRVRWAQGMVQILMLKNPLRQKGLHWWQRLGYFNSAFFWCFPFARVIFMLAPSAFLIFGLQIYEGTLTQFFAYTIPHLVAVLMVSHYLFGRARWTFVSELYELTQSLYVISGLVRVMISPHSPSFMVTPKGEQHDEDFITELSTPFYWLFVLILVSLAFGVWRWFHDPATRDATMIIMMWELFNFVLISGVMGVLLERRQRRVSPRMPSDAAAALVTAAGQRVAVSFVNLSATGCRLRLAEPLASECNGALALDVCISSLRQQVTLPLRLAWQRGEEVGVAFAPSHMEDKRRIIALVYGDSQRWVKFRRERSALATSIPRAAWFLIRHGAVGLFVHFGYLSRIAWRQLARAVLHIGHILRCKLVKAWQRTRAWALDQPPT